MCTFEEIKKANESIKTTDIKGKAYAEVNQRIKVFRMLHPNGLINTEMVSNDGEVCIFRAEIYSEDQRLLGTGTAFECKSNSFINKTSYIENCETSAVGRALAMCGIGIDTSIASADEVANAIENQDEKKKEPKKSVAVQEAELKAKVLGYINRKQMSVESIQKLCACYKVKSINDLSGEHCKHYIETLSKKGINIDE